MSLDDLVNADPNSEAPKFMMQEEKLQKRDVFVRVPKASPPKVSTHSTATPLGDTTYHETQKTSTIQPQKSTTRSITLQPNAIEAPVTVSPGDANNTESQNNRTDGETTTQSTAGNISPQSEQPAPAALDNINNQSTAQMNNGGPQKTSTVHPQKPKIKHYIGGGAIGGSIVGLIILGIAYSAKAAVLTSLTVAGGVGVSIAATVGGALVGALIGYIGYGIAKFCEKVSEEKGKDSDMSTGDAIKTLLKNTFTNCVQNDDLGMI